MEQRTVLPKTRWRQGADWHAEVVRREVRVFDLGTDRNDRLLDRGPHGVCHGVCHAPGGDNRRKADDLTGRGLVTAVHR